MQSLCFDGQFEIRDNNKKEVEIRHQRFIKQNATITEMKCNTKQFVVCRYVNKWKMIQFVFIFCHKYQWQLRSKKTKLFVIAQSTSPGKSLKRCFLRCGIRKSLERVFQESISTLVVIGINDQKRKWHSWKGSRNWILFQIFLSTDIL